MHQPLVQLVHWFILFRKCVCASRVGVTDIEHRAKTHVQVVFCSEGKKFQLLIVVIK
jgi:hypothetical protein